MAALGNVLVPPDTSLRGRLSALYDLNESGLEVVLKDTQGEWVDGEKAKDEIVHHFYAEEPLAYAVAQGKDSYVKRIQCIEEKYDSLWNRIFLPQEDKAFDDSVREVLGSLNRVGQASVDVNLYTCVGRREESFSSRKRRLYIVSACLSVVAGGLTYQLREDFHHNSSVLYGMGTGVVVAMMLGGALAFGSLVKTEKALDELKDAARETDLYLKSMYAVDRINAQRQEKNTLSFVR